MSRLCLIIIDGFGVAPPGPGNARTLARMPVLREIERTVPSVLMQASGNAVGLPDGQQGASEPGHLTIGAGRIVWQPLEQISRSIRLGEFFQNPVLLAACRRSRERTTPLHIIGMYSRGGVHSHIDHLHAMLHLAKQEGVPQVFLHMFGDGRDVPEQHFCTEFPLLNDVISREQLGIVASLIGRFYAMDRDKQYSTRTKVAYDLLTQGHGELTDDLLASVRSWYVQAPPGQKTDYYIRPLKSHEFQPVRGQDTVVCVNFRSDRMIQIVRALEDEDFHDFPRPVRVSDVVCMGPYSDHLPVAFPPMNVKHTLGEMVSRAGMRQLRVAETDKFAHVTFFFNAQVHEPYAGEERILVESPKVPNFAETPAMSAAELTRVVCDRAASKDVDFIVMNYANPDLVGHGGNLAAAVQACETIDEQLSILLPALQNAGYDWVITADHGNAECMYLDDGATINPSHTTSPVQTFVHASIFPDAASLGHCSGLKDIAPLCLRILGIPVPQEMA